MTKLFEELTADDITARIKHRLDEFNNQPCYRCGHTLASPDKKCACCAAGHDYLREAA